MSHAASEREHTTEFTTSGKAAARLAAAAPLILFARHIDWLDVAGLERDHSR